MSKDQARMGSKQDLILENLDWTPNLKLNGILLQYAYRRTCGISILDN